MSDTFEYNVRPKLVSDDPMPKLRPVLQIIGANDQPIGEIPDPGPLPGVLEVATKALSLIHHRDGTLNREATAERIVSALYDYGVLIPYEEEATLPMADSAEEEPLPEGKPDVKYYFDPFAKGRTIEENNTAIARGEEPIILNKFGGDDAYR